MNKKMTLKAEIFRNVENAITGYLSFSNNAKKQLLENILSSKGRVIMSNNSKVSENNYSGLYSLFLEVEKEYIPAMITELFVEKLKLIETTISEELKLLLFHKENFSDYIKEYIENEENNYKIKLLLNENTKKIEINENELYSEILEGINFLSNHKKVKYKAPKYKIYSYIYYNYDHPINGKLLDIKDYLEEDFKIKFINSIIKDNKIFLGEIYIKSTQYVKNLLKEMTEKHIKDNLNSSEQFTNQIRDLLETLTVEIQRKKINRLYEGEIFKKSDDVFEYFITNDSLNVVIKTGCFFLKELYRLDEEKYKKLKLNIVYNNKII